MERETAPVESIFKGRRAKVQITAPTYEVPYICTGYVYCLQGRRLSDNLNDVFTGTMPENKDFLSARDVKMYSLRGAGEAV